MDARHQAGHDGERLVPGQKTGKPWRGSANRAPISPTCSKRKSPPRLAFRAFATRSKAWREDGYKGVSDTTRILLNYWFYTDHRLPDGRKFKYHSFQREAIETLIYLYEVAKVRRHKSLVETFATRSDLRLLQYDDFARYAVKMATGSGKTKVMSLAIAWQFFNAVAEARDDFAKTFLIIAPNVIVFERLRTDFEGGRIFRGDPSSRPSCKSTGTISSVTCVARASGQVRSARSI